MAAAVDGIGHAALDEQLGDVGAATGPQRSRAQRLRTVSSRSVSSSAQRTSTAPAGGSSSVLSNAFWASGLSRWAAADDGHAEATLERQEGKLDDERPCLVDADLAAGAGRCEPMQVGMVAVVDLPTRRARRDMVARWGRRARHSRPAARSSASVVLPTRAGPATRTAFGGRSETTARATTSRAAG